MNDTLTAASRHLPRVHGALPLVGHLGAFLRDPIGLLERAQHEHDGVAAFRLGPQQVVLLTGPDGHASFFRAPDAQLNQRDAYQLMIPVFGPGVVYDASPERMVEQFHFLIPAFQDRRMRTYSALVDEEARLAIEDWGDEGSVDVYPFTRRLVGRTSTRASSGQSSGTSSPTSSRRLTRRWRAVSSRLPTLPRICRRRRSGDGIAAAVS